MPALLVLLPSWLGLMGSWSWQLDLLANFRWQYLVAGIIVLAWGIWSRQALVIASALLTVLLNAVLIGALAWQPELRRATLAPDFQLRVLSVNVLSGNNNTRSVTDHVLASGADVVLVLEVNEKWAAALPALESQYPYRSVHPQQGNFGLALYSRIPFIDPQVLLLGEAQRPTIAVRLMHQGRELLLIGTHPVPPMGEQLAMQRDEQMSLLADYVEQSRLPVVLVGDLNATPWSEGMRRLTSGTLAFRGLDPPWVPTWRKGSPFAVPIDHALCTAPLVITRRHVGPDVGSDHRPILVEFGWAS